jgi:hypothetical protein
MVPLESDVLPTQEPESVGVLGLVGDGVVLLVQAALVTATRMRAIPRRMT